MGHGIKGKRPMAKREAFFHLCIDDRRDEETRWAENEICWAGRSSPGEEADGIGPPGMAIKVPGGKAADVLTTIKQLTIRPRNDKNFLSLEALLPDSSTGRAGGC